MNELNRLLKWYIALRDKMDGATAVEYGLIVALIAVVIIAMMFILSGCASTKTVPVTMNFPQAPEPLLMEPEKLETLPEDATQLSEILDNSTVNYGKYRELQLKYEQWQRWYDSNRLIHKETQEK